ncbi:MAG: DUF4175 family protein [Cytophagales bacterium]|nr:MAG: DUF4175 family protein [Cytophagales bacterium]
MEKSRAFNDLLLAIQQYKQKYYLNHLLKGVLVALAIITATYTFFNLLEYFGRFDTWVRATFFFTFMAALAIVVFQGVLIPLSYIIRLNKQISDEKAAEQIGLFFPDIQDKLLNTLQLQQHLDTNNSLLIASISQRTQTLAVVRFSEAIRLEENKKYLKYVLPPLFLFFVILIISPNIFTESSTRILNYHLQYAEPAPFQFYLNTKNLDGFKNEDITLSLQIKGTALPQEVYLWVGERQYKMEKQNQNTYTYTFKKLQKNTLFHFEAAGYSSDSYEINLKERPNMLSFDAYLEYPAYLGKTPETWNNIGNLIVPEGTKITWRFNTEQTEELSLIFGKKENLKAIQQNNKQFEFKRMASKSENYQIKLKNQHSENKEDINYFINVVPDQYPKISIQTFKDETTFQAIAVAGNISDDYGFSALKFFYRIDRNGKEGSYQTINIPLQQGQTIQNYSQQLNLESLALQPGDKLYYFVQVWDNDGVNGAKAARTSPQLLDIPSNAELKNEINNSIEKTENQINKAIQKSQEIQQTIENAEKKLQSKNTMDYQDKKTLQEIIKKREELKQEIQQLQEQNEQLKEQQDRFDEQKSEELQKKMEQLQKLMDELMDEETKKLYEELQKLLEQNRSNDEILKQLDKIQFKEDNLENEIKRALEMFKQIQFEQKLEQTTEELKELAEQQQELSEQTTDKKQDMQELMQEQEQINQKFEDLQKELDQLQEMNEELEEPNSMQDTEQQEQEIEQEQQNSMQQMQNNQRKEAQKSQQNSAQKMKEMSQQLEEMQQEQEQEQSQENIDDLRAILENLLSLSFNQEKLMKDLRNVATTDPRYLKLAQEQIKLKDDAKIIEDSLLALAKRVFEIESFVTREVSQMKQYMNESSDNIKTRRISIATGKQQLAMTSMNNLALMLNDALQQMQQAMANAQMNAKGKGKKQSKSMSQMQQQLNQQIQQLQQSQKSGRQLSEELAKLAAEQERIRKMIQEMEGKMNNLDGKAKDELSKQLQDLKKMMEETEKDLVNKNLNQNTLNRQQEIITRLLESEKAMKEQGEEEQRKAETAKTQEKTIIPDLNKIVKQKEKQIEMLKTVPPALSPYYKKEIDEYFEKIGE